jgi:hypothetical protein
MGAQRARLPSKMGPSGDPLPPQRARFLVHIAQQSAGAASATVSVSDLPNAKRNPLHPIHLPPVLPIPIDRPCRKDTASSPDGAKMKADPEKAQSIGARLVFLKDSLAKQSSAIDAAALKAILDDASPNASAAEQELLMALRFYTQEREQQIACGEFQFCSSPEEHQEARLFSRARAIVFDPANLKGIESVRTEIEDVIRKDILADAIKWNAVAAKDDSFLKEWSERWKPSQSPANDTAEESMSRKKFAEGSLQWIKDKNRAQFQKYYGWRIADAMRRMFDEHRDYWAQRPTEPYSPSGLDSIFAFALGGRNYGLGELFTAWGLYLERRIEAHNRRSGVPFQSCTAEEAALVKEDRRRLPIEWPHSHSNAREIAESHISAILREDIAADTVKWERHNREVEQARKLYQKNRLLRIEKHRNAFVAKVRNLFGQQVVELISEADLQRYGLGLVDGRQSEEDLWYSILKQYKFDQNTNSCLYFIRQGTAIKIGITDNLDQRIAQIKTSAALPCEIVNVVYTHHGKILERKLHQALDHHNSHLEWFILPSKIEKMLLSAKSAEDIENILNHVGNEESDDLPQEATREIGPVCAGSFEPLQLADPTPLYRFFRPILWENRDPEFPYSVGGTAVVIELADRFFLLTANHCLDRSIAELRVPFRLRSEAFFLIDKDIGFRPVSQDIESQDDLDIRILSLNGPSCPSKPLESGEYLSVKSFKPVPWHIPRQLSGFPVSEQWQDFENGKFGGTGLTLNGVDGGPTSDPGCHTFLSEELPNLPADGLSGGAVTSNILGNIHLEGICIRGARQGGASSIRYVTIESIESKLREAFRHSSRQASATPRSS